MRTGGLRLIWSNPPDTGAPPTLITQHQAPTLPSKTSTKQSINQSSPCFPTTPPNVRRSHPAPTPHRPHRTHTETNPPIATHPPSLTQPQLQPPTPNPQPPRPPPNPHAHLHPDLLNETGRDKLKSSVVIRGACAAVVGREKVLSNSSL